MYLCGKFHLNKKIMNREILFRGKRCSDDKWVYGFYVESKHSWQGHKPHKSWIVPNAISNGGFFNILGRYAVKDDTVGQFTGLLDKHGKQVFGGDIVECVSWNEYFSKDGQPMEPFRRKMYVDFRRGGFKMVEPMPESMKDNEWDIIYNGHIVVIGNRYDNPELLAAK